MLLATKVAMASNYTCGGINNLIFSGTIPYIVSTVVLLIKIVVPILLIIFGMLDLGKAVVASKEDEIKKGQQLFMKRVISAVVVFFVIQLVQIIIRFVSQSNTSVIQCFNCFIYGESSDTACVYVD